MAQLTRSTFDPKVSRWWWRTLRQWLYELIDPLYASFRGENSEDLTLTNVTQLNGVTASELATLDGITATTAEMNKLGGLTADATDLNKTDRSSADGDAEASKVVVLNVNKDVFGKRFDINRSTLSGAIGKTYYHFDGVNDYIEIGSDSKYFRSPKVCIIMEGLKIEHINNIMTNGEALLGIWANSSNYIQVFIGSYSSGFTAETITLSIWMGGNSIDYYTTDTTILDGESHTISLCLDNSPPTFFIDGKEISVSTNGSNGHVGFDLGIDFIKCSIGARYINGSPSSFMACALSRVLIYNTIPQDGEILAITSGGGVDYSQIPVGLIDLVANGDAFTGATGSTPPSSWSDSGAGTATYIIRNNTGVANMDADTLEFSSSGGEKILKQAILTPGKRYRLSFAYRNFDGSAASYVYMGTSANQAILTHTTFVGDGILFSQEFIADGADLGYVVADGGGIQIDNVQVLPIGCVAQYEPDGIGSTTWYDKSGNGLHGTVNGATAMNLPMAYVNDAGRHMVEGESGQRAVLRSTRIRIQPGATPGTNLNIIEAGGVGYNTAVISSATNLAKSGTSGSFSLDASGTIITLDISEDIVGILSGTVLIHDINSSATNELYTPNLGISGNNLTIGFIKRGSSGVIDLTTLFDAGDICDLMVTYITSP